MFQRGLFLSLIVSVGMIVGACASSTPAEVAATDGAHQCSADCQHDASHKCTESCKHDKNHQCTADCQKDHKCSAACKHGAKGETTAAATTEECKMHASHKHVHGAKCGHKTVKHGDHTDYSHDGHQHHVHDNHVDEHKAVKTSAAPTPSTEG